MPVIPAETFQKLVVFEVWLLRGRVPVPERIHPLNGCRERQTVLASGNLLGGYQPGTDSTADRCSWGLG
jgi:hypothetical protein